MEVGKFELKVSLWYVEYTGKEEDRERFFALLYERIFRYFGGVTYLTTFNDDGSFSLKYGNKFAYDELTIRIGNVLVFSPGYGFYSEDSLFDGSIFFPFALYSGEDFKNLLAKGVCV